MRSGTGRRGPDTIKDLFVVTCVRFLTWGRTARPSRKVDPQYNYRYFVGGGWSNLHKRKGPRSLEQRGSIAVDSDSSGRGINCFGRSIHSSGRRIDSSRRKIDSSGRRIDLSGIRTDVSGRRRINSSASAITSSARRVGPLAEESKTFR